MDIYSDIWFWIALFAYGWFCFTLGKTSILIRLKDDIRERIVQGDLKVSDQLREALDVPAEECHFNVERHQGQYYAFADSGEFLAQGTDFRTMFESIKQRFPNRNFRIQRMQTELTEEETNRMVRAIFETFGDKKHD